MERFVYVIEFIDENDKRGTMVTYDAHNKDECYAIFRKNIGRKAYVKKITKMSEYDYKHLI